jgi:phospholipid-binding lipoprotein MlaA
MNRMVFAVNKAADTALIKPVATVYTRITPSFLQTGLSNMVNNMADVITVVNSALQFKWEQAARNLGRVVTNTTVGLAGFFDLATRDGFVRGKEDFGQTLGFWGVPPGPYLVLPLLGPSTVRDGTGLIVDFYTYPPTWLITDVRAANITYAATYVIVRADRLEAQQFVSDAAVDEYSFVREAFLQQRINLIWDGNPPKEKLEDDDAGESAASDKGAAAPDETPADPVAKASALD